MCAGWRPRTTPTDDAHAVAAEQIRALLGRLPADGPVSLGVFDAGYDPTKLTRELGDLDGERVAVLVRLRRGRCCYADPNPAAAHRSPAPPRAEAGLRRPDHLVGADGGAPQGARPARGGAGAGVG